MFFRGTADDVQLSTLAMVLDDYCEQAGIEDAHPARELFARGLLALFVGGSDIPDDVRVLLDTVTKGRKPDDMHAENQHSSDIPVPLLYEAEPVSDPDSMPR